MQTTFQTMILPALFIGLAYLAGSFPSGVLYSKYFHKADVRNLGSGNSGATNIGRNFGFKAAAIVTFFDALKGLVPVLISKQLFPQQDLIIILVAIACILGHAFPIFAGFRGGKIVATSVGVLLAFDFLAALLMIGLFAALLYLTSMVSFAAIVSYTLVALMIVLTYPQWEYRLGFLFMAAFLIYRHRANIQRLLRNEESRINWGLQSPKRKR